MDPVDSDLDSESGSESGTDASLDSDIGIEAIELVTEEAVADELLPVITDSGLIDPVAVIALVVTLGFNQVAKKVGDKFSPLLKYFTPAAAIVIGTAVWAGISSAQGQPLSLDTFVAGLGIAGMSVLGYEQAKGAKKAGTAVLVNRAIKKALAAEAKATKADSE